MIKRKNGKGRGVRRRKCRRMDQKMDDAKRNCKIEKVETRRKSGIYGRGRPRPRVARDQTKV